MRLPWLEHLQALSGGVCIAGASFIQDELRDADFKYVSPSTPPFLGKLLVRSHNQISTRPRREVTWNRGFKVKSRLHIQPPRSLWPPNPSQVPRHPVKR